MYKKKLPSQQPKSAMVILAEKVIDARRESERVSKQTSNA